MEPDTATMPEHDTNAASVPGEHGLEIWISYVLRVGVLIAAAIILIGLVLLIVRGEASVSATSLHQTVRDEQQMTIRPSTILHGVATGNALNIIQLGVFVLILTPVTRVAMTVVLFFALRDKIFTAVTLAVFLILLFGLTGLGS